MKKKFFIVITVVLLSSCGKYEEGPEFSLRSKTKRLAREWTVSKVIENGADITDDYKSKYKTHILHFLDYGSLKETINENVFAKAWYWGEKKETVVIDTFKIKILDEVHILDLPRVLTIKQLTCKDFWYTTVVDEKNREYRWSAK